MDDKGPKADFYRCCFVNNVTRLYVGNLGPTTIKYRVGKEHKHECLRLERVGVCYIFITWMEKNFDCFCVVFKQQ